MFKIPCALSSLQTDNRSKHVRHPALLPTTPPQTSGHTSSRQEASPRLQLAFRHAIGDSLPAPAGCANHSHPPHAFSQTITASSPTPSPLSTDAALAPLAEGTSSSIASSVISSLRSRNRSSAWAFLGTLMVRIPSTWEASAFDASLSRGSW